MPNVHELIRDHVTLSIRCLDRLYLHAYLPKLQTSGGLCYFLRDHLGHPIPSPALFAPMLERFVGAIKAYATTHDVPFIPFARGQRKDDVVAEYRARRPMGDGVVVIGVAPERMRRSKPTDYPRGATPCRSISRGNPSRSITTTSTSRTRNGARRS